MGSFMFCDTQKYFSGDQIKEIEIGEACGTCGDEEECVQGFGEIEWRKVKTLETWASVAGY
jgi:hypothetical protein